MTRRRTQEERTADTRAALIDATIAVISREGYAGASTALIAKEARMTRGAILHQFGTRATLMAAVIRAIFEREISEYRQMDERSGRPDPSGWVSRCWEVFARPSGVVMIEVLLAARSDSELAEKIGPMQSLIEQSALRELLGEHFARTDVRNEAVAQMRLIVWAVRGLVLGQLLTPDAGNFRDSVDMLRELFQKS